MFEQSLKFFVVLFVVVEPISLIPLFTGLTAGASTGYKRRMALKAVAISAMILLLFAVGGAAFLQLMGISLEAFRIFGGLLLFLLALLWVAEPLMRVIGVTGANVASRLLGVILGALAVQFVLDGLRQAFAVS